MERVSNQFSSIGKAGASTIDVIVPTYNKKGELLRSLKALAVQEGLEGWRARVIICDDGSEVGTHDIVEAVEWLGWWEAPRVLVLPHQGRSAARNAGIAASDAQIILFLADDIVLREGAIAEHLRFHTKHPQPHCAALGWVVWDPLVHPTPFMEWMVHGGQQNDFDALLGGQACAPENYFYGSHVSVKRLFLGKDMFDHQFLAYGWEDLELGARLQAKGLQLTPLPKAVGLHAHWYNAEKLLARQRVVGAQKYQVNTKPMRWLIHELYRLFGLRSIVVWGVKKWGNRLNFPRFFHIVTAGEFWYGVHHANRVLKREKYYLA